MGAGDRIAQLNTDFKASLQYCAVALDGNGSIVGFAYTLPLNSATWRIAVETRGSFFATLPEGEFADIKAAPPQSLPAVLVTGATHLPGYDHVGPALREWLFAKGRNRHTLEATYIAYHLLTADCLELPEIVAAGLTRRERNIQVGGSIVDDWILRFAERGFVGWIAEALGIDHVTPYAQQVPEVELIDQVKFALDNIHRLDRLQASPLIRLLQVRGGHYPGVELRDCILKSVRNLEASTSLASRQSGALLADYYLERIGSMELVAERLRLPRTTFYRRLRRGLALVSEQLRMQELAQTSSN